MTARRNRLARWLVRLFPVDMREAHGREIEQTLTDGRRDRSPGSRGAFAYWLRASLDVFRVAIRQHTLALRQDVAYTLRTFARGPAFAAGAILTIGLGTGAAAAVFTIVNAVLIRPLPFANADELALLWSVDPRGNRSWLSYPEVVDLSERSTTLAGVAGLMDLRLALSGTGDPEELSVIAASASTFDILGVRAQVGRLLESDDDLPESPRVVFLSDGLWTRRFGASPSVLGSTITLDSRPYLVAGVLPSAFTMVAPSSVFPKSADAWVALEPHLGSRARDVRYLHGVARLKTGVSPAAARDEITAIAVALQREHATGVTGSNRGLTLVRMDEDVVSSVRPALLALLGLVLLVLLIACVNVATLLLARSDARRREMAIRTALGASRGRLLRQLLTEGFVLSLCGTAVGLLVTIFVPRIGHLPALSSLPRFADLTVDWRVALFALAVCVWSAVLFALAPAVELSRHASLRRGEVLRASSNLRKTTTVRRVLAGSQIALASAVLLVALMFVQLIARLIDTHPGFESADVMTARVALPATYARPGQAPLFFDRVVDRLSNRSGVAAAAAITQLPLSGAVLGSSFDPEDADTTRRLDVDLRGVTPDYFRALQVPVMRGRSFSAADGPTAAPVAIVDEEFARRMWPGQDPIGRRVRWFRQPDVPIEIVGVVGSVRHAGIAQPARPTVYRPHAQYVRLTMYLVVRNASTSVVQAGDLAAAVRAVDSAQPIAEVATMAALRTRSLAAPGFGAALGSTLALLAALLTAVGIFGLHAFSAQQRRREIAVRLALGGTPGTVKRAVLTESAVVAAAGALTGLGAAFVVLGWARGLLDLGPSPDASLIAATLGVMIAVALVACWIPARRASRTNPAEALRAE
jgi:putative ABC transport system permease protein